MPEYHSSADLHKPRRNKLTASYLARYHVDIPKPKKVRKKKPSLPSKHIVAKIQRLRKYPPIPPNYYKRPPLRAYHKINDSPVTASESEYVVNNWFPVLKNMGIISIRPERLEACYDRLQGLAQFAHHVKSENGALIDKKQWIKQKRCTSYLRRGQLGCFQSHKNAWTELLHDSTNTHMFILEDDVNLTPHLDTYNLIKNAFTQIKQKNIQWDILFIGRNHKYCVEIALLSKNIVSIGTTYGLFGYVINKKAAKYLLSKSTVMRKEVDLWLTSHNITRDLDTIAITPIPFGVVPVRSDTCRIK